MQRLRVVMLVALGLAACGRPASAPSPITVHVSPSRTSGVAPLAVFFDATATTGLDGDDFLSASFSWDFGDAQAGTFATTGLAKNLATGFVAAHVFETPGTYTVAVNVQDRTGAKGTPATVKITVTDPATVYAGKATRCVSQAGDFTGAPAGCEEVTSTDLQAQIAWVNGAPARRLLLRAGETWPDVTVSLTGKGPNTVGAFGTGARPILVLGTKAGQDTAVAISGSDWRIQGLDLDGTNLPPHATEGSNEVGVGGTEVLGDDLYIHDGHDVGWGAGGDEDYLYDSKVVHTGYFAVYVDGVGQAILGSRVDQMRLAVSFVRPTASRNVYVADNRVDASRAQPTTAIKWHSRRGVITDNVLTAGTARIALTTSDVECDFTSYAVDKNLGVVLIERNVLEPDGNPANDDYTSTGVEIGEDHAMVRNNLLYDMDLAFDGRCGSSDVHVLDNTVYMTDHTTGLNVGNGDFLDVAAPPVKGWEVRNNVMWSENPGTNGWGDLINLASPQGLTLSNNVYFKPLKPKPFGIGTLTNLTLYDLPGWQKLGLDAGSKVADPKLMSVDPSSPDFFRLGAGSPAIGAGAQVPVFEDFYRHPRPAKGPYDAGAIAHP